MEAHIAVAAQAIQQPGGVAFALGAALPGPGLGGGAEPQPPADQDGNCQPSEPGPGEAGLGGQGAGDQAGGQHQGCPPGQAVGPGGQLGGATAPVVAAGRAAGVAQAAGGLLGREHRLGRG
jgi:hypothetical protein